VEQALTRVAEAKERAKSGRAEAEQFAWPMAARRLLHRYDTIHRARLAGTLAISAHPITVNV
jgi:hypothetical protein